MINLFALIVAVLTLAWISVLVRFYVKIFLTRRVRWDDWILLLAMIFFTGQCGCTLVMTSVDHKDHSAAPHVVSSIFLASSKLSIMTAICIKTSLAISLNRFFAKRWQRMLIVGMTTTFNTYAIAEMILSLFFCGLPGDMVRKSSLQQCAHWSSILLWWLVASIFNAITDWIYILLPTCVVWMSKLSLQFKASISFISVVGALSGTAATIRIFKSGSFAVLRDFNTTNLEVLACVILEMALGIIATSMLCSTQASNTWFLGTEDIAAETSITTNHPEDGTANIIKLSPIICQPESVDEKTSIPSLSKKPVATQQEVLMLPTPSRKTNRFSWSRTFSIPESSTTRMTLLIDDISDEEEEERDDNGESRTLKKPLSNV